MKSLDRAARIRLLLQLDENNRVICLYKVVSMSLTWSSSTSRTFDLQSYLCKFIGHGLTTEHKDTGG